MWNRSLGENLDRHRPRVIVLCLVLRGRCVFDSYLITTSYPSMLEGLYQETNKPVQNCIPMGSSEMYVSFGIFLSHNRETISYFYTPWLQRSQVKIYAPSLRRSWLKFIPLSWDGPREILYPDIEAVRCEYVYFKLFLPICTVGYME